MKRVFFVAILYVGVALLSCQDSRETLSDSVPESASLKMVGERIPVETGMQWIDFYKKKNEKEGRIGLSPFHISDGQMETMLQSVDHLVGVAFHYGKDESGATHIIAVPIDETLTVWSDIPGRIYVDANSGEAIDKAVAQAWADTYKAANPNGIWFHFFGANIFDDMTSLSFFNSVEIQQAINILNLSPQLLLIVWNDLSILGRSQDADPVIYDASNPCPPCGVN